ncbi:MAG: sodium:solute symporter family protein, partial [Synergistota bacterium]|nr:sodium:solute symporter family protein [Synergistota bacterium]
VRGESRRPEQDPLMEDRFIFHNRIAITVISTAALIISFFNLPGILILGRYSWSVVAICFLLPLYSPLRPSGRGLFAAIGSALILHTLLVVFGGQLPEIAMLYSLLLEALLWACAARGGKR